MVRRYEHSRLYLMHHCEVPVIAVFTKYDQYLYNVAMHIFDYPNEYPGAEVSEVAEKRFQERYLRPLGDDIVFVRLARAFSVKYQERMLMFFGRNAYAK